MFGQNLCQISLRMYVLYPTSTFPLDINQKNKAKYVFQHKNPCCFPKHLYLCSVVVKLLRFLGIRKKVITKEQYQFIKLRYQILRLVFRKKIVLIRYQEKSSFQVTSRLKCRKKNPIYGGFFRWGGVIRSFFILCPFILFFYMRGELTY